MSSNTKYLRAIQLLSVILNLTSNEPFNTEVLFLELSQPTHYCKAYSGLRLYSPAPHSCTCGPSTYPYVPHSRPSLHTMHFRSATVVPHRSLKRFPGICQANVCPDMSAWPPSSSIPHLHVLRRKVWLYSGQCWGAKRVSRAKLHFLSLGQI